MKVISSIRSNPVLRISAGIAFKACEARQHVGVVEVAFSIQNTSNFDAVRPFICFPVTVMKFTPCPGWTTSYFDSDTGRRMIRFTSKSDRALAAGAIAKSCVMRLPFSRSGGGQLTIARTVERPLSSLPDLRFFAITGAGNFAPERASIAIPASEIRAAIRRGWPQIEANAGLVNAS